MSGAFLALAELSGEELARVAGALLAELEGGVSPRGAAWSQAGAEARMLPAAEALVSAAALSAAAAAEVGSSPVRAAFDPFSGSGAFASAREGASGGAQMKKRAAIAAQGSASGGGAAAAAFGGPGSRGEEEAAEADPERLSEFFRRDSRRWDAGFEQY